MFGIKILSMNSIFRFPKSYAAHLVYVFLLPLFFISFCFLYNPFGIQEFYHLAGGKSFAFHIVLLTCIQIGTFALSRLGLFLLLRKHTILWWHYAVWCVSEVLVAACFMALYTTLFFGTKLPFFPALFYCEEYSYLVLIYPYLIFVLIRIAINLSSDLSSRGAVKEDELVKFYDDHKKLRITIDPEAILYISAEANYLKIHYLNNGGVKEFLLRNSMKSVEANNSAHSLVRCHRSYFINPHQVSVLSRSKDGFIFAELKLKSLGPIPVSKQYYDKLSDML